MRIGLLLVIGLALACGSERAPEATPAQTKMSPNAKPGSVQPELVGLETFDSILSGDRAAFETARAAIEAKWRDGYAVMLLEMASFLPPERRSRVFAMIKERTKSSATTSDELFQWIWRTKPVPHPQYARFKELFYSQIDPRFAAYFDNTSKATIRLDEVRWGGVRRDGIPPLKNPTMLPASSATYLDDSNVVFGIEINGDARAYPKRILAWHEMFKDTVGGESVNGVYCTLCGSMILYRTTHNGVHHELGTSGFLYRSNKLMYDHATESMWTTLGGTPVIGPLVGRGVVLETLSVVTTTWGEWRRRHPKTTVLSLNTGHQRDYDEGAAYREYFATDELMFTVPALDSRLKNKAEVLALRFGEDDAKPTAVSVEFLRKNPLFHGSLGRIDYVIVTDSSGANRVYRASGLSFSTDPSGDLIDNRGTRWKQTEAALVGPHRSLQRLSAHRAFWFGWHAAHPNTLLIK